MTFGRTNTSSEYVGRVFQLDSVHLDNAISSIVCDQLKLACNYLPLNTYVDFQPEIVAVVKFIIGKYSYIRTGSSAGQSLLGLGYNCASSRRQKLWLLLVLNILPAYICARLCRFLSAAGLDDEKRHKVERWLTTAEGVVRLLSVANLLVFLQRGDYPTLTTRLLKLPLRKVDGSAFRTSNINHTFVAREHLWRGFVELLVCLGPLYNWRNLGRSLIRTIRTQITSLPLLSTLSSPISEPAGGDVERDQVAECVACRLDACLPYVLSSCGHVMCYQCAAVMRSGTEVRCDRCGVCTDYDQVRPLPSVGVSADKHQPYTHDHDSSSVH